MIKFGAITMLILVSQALLPSLVLPAALPVDLILEDSTGMSQSLTEQPVPEVTLDRTSIQDTTHFSPHVAIIAPGVQCYADFNQRVIHESL